jgi:cell division protein ZapA (FtsZ GTPase activity inhibitor)
MNTEAKNYKVIIFEEEYHLISDEQQESVLEAAAYVNQMMKELASCTPRAQKHKLAVLAALQCASQMIQAKKSLEMRKMQEKELVNRTEKIISSL